MIFESDLEPGEELDQIWNEEIEQLVVGLLKSKLKNIGNMTTKPHYQRHWLDVSAANDRIMHIEI